ncbi:hypothetical protein QR98_0098250 [Sarcoptes scabiei]|uniref:CMP domain-containing protein n=1 Tax=Sarcoptes scabiei TaxID=52283 RepID=A0A132AL05_SARSC|nr:hypothetical protein QR98_0098250 [Sarcoptes scabiei]
MTICFYVNRDKLLKDEQRTFLQLRNWKPLTLDQICENTELTIGDILSDICSFVTLRIRLCSVRIPIESRNIN